MMELARIQSMPPAQYSGILRSGTRKIRNDMKVNRISGWLIRDGKRTYKILGYRHGKLEKLLNQSPGE